MYVLETFEMGLMCKHCSLGFLAWIWFSLFSILILKNRTVLNQAKISGCSQTFKPACDLVVDEMVKMHGNIFVEFLFLVKTRTVCAGEIPAATLANSPGPPRALLRLLLDHGPRAEREERVLSFLSVLHRWTAVVPRNSP